MKKNGMGLKLKLILINAAIISVLVLISTFIAVDTSIDKVTEVSNIVKDEIDNSLNEKLKKSAEIVENLIHEKKARIQKDAVFLAYTEDVKDLLLNNAISRTSSLYETENKGELVKKYRKITNETPYLKLIVDLKRRLYGVDETQENIEIVNREKKVYGKFLSDYDDFKEKDNSKIINFMFENRGEGFSDIVTSKKGVAIKSYGNFLYNYKSYGAIIITTPLDLYFLQSIKNLTDTEVLIYQKDKFIDGTFFKYGKEIEKLYFPNEPIIYDALKNGKNMYIENKNIDFGVVNGEKIKEKHRFVYIPLKNYSNEIVGMLAMITPTKGLDLSIENFNKTKQQLVDKLSAMLIASAMFGLFVGTIFIYFYSDNIVKPLKKVLDIVNGVSKGELDKKISVKTKDEVGELAKGINNMIENLKENEKIKDEFIANTSHELRTPLHGIIGISQIVLDEAIGVLNDEQKKKIETVIASARRLLNLVNDLLDFSKMKTQEIGLLKEGLDLETEINYVIEVLNPILDGKDIKIENNVKKDTYFVYADEEKLQQIFFNLIGNAVKFTNKGGVYIDAVEEKDFIKVRIRDTGIGISEENIKNIFKSFTQEDGSISRNFGGTGLGLSISKKLVELHNGVIDVESEKGVGSTFMFTLPRSKDGKRKEEEKKDLVKNLSTYIMPTNILKEENMPELIEKASYSILVVDDEPVNITIIESYIKQGIKNVKMKSVLNGKDALEAIKIESYDIILLDIMMPEMSGYEVCEKLRKEYSPLELPILILTAKSRVEDIARGFEIGANDYVIKPFQKTELLARIFNLVEMKKSFISSLENARFYANEKKQRLLETSLKDLSRDLGATLNFDQVIEIFTRKIKEFIGYKKIEIYLNTAGHISSYFKGDKQEESLFKTLDEVKNVMLINNEKRSKLAAPMIYGEKTLGYIVLEGEKDFFNNEKKELISIFIEQVSFSIENSLLFEALNKKTVELNEIVEKLKSVEKLATVIYTEKDKAKAVYYILLLMVSKLKIAYTEGVFFEYDSKEDVLTKGYYFHNVNNLSDENSNLEKLKERELMVCNLKVDMKKEELIEKTFKNGPKWAVGKGDVFSNENLNELSFENFSLLPIVYEEKRYGLMILKRDNKIEDIQEHEKELINIFLLNLGVYFENRRLESETIKKEKLEVVLKLAKSIIHEIRTPLVSIKGFAELIIKKSKDDTNIKRYSEIILKESLRVDEMAEDLIDYSGDLREKIEFGKVGLRELLEEVIKDKEEEIRESGIKLKKDMGQELWIDGDKKYLKKAIKGLLKNAIEASKGEEDFIFIKLYKEESKIKLLIEDKGIGIEEDRQEEILEPFVSTKIQGTGFGLSLISKILELHSAKLNIESKKGNGTKIEIEFIA